MAQRSFIRGRAPSPPWGLDVIRTLAAMTTGDHPTQPAPSSVSERAWSRPVIQQASRLRSTTIHALETSTSPRGPQTSAAPSISDNPCPTIHVAPPDPFCPAQCREAHTLSEGARDHLPAVLFRAVHSGTLDGHIPSTSPVRNGRMEPPNPSVFSSSLALHVQLDPGPSSHNHVPTPWLALETWPKMRARIRRWLDQDVQDITVYAIETHRLPASLPVYRAAGLLSIHCSSTCTLMHNAEAQYLAMGSIPLDAVIWQIDPLRGAEQMLSPMFWPRVAAAEAESPGAHRPMWCASWTPLEHEEWLGGREPSTTPPPLPPRQPPRVDRPRTPERAITLPPLEFQTDSLAPASMAMMSPPVGSRIRERIMAVLEELRHQPVQGLRLREVQL